jgi:signal transduction histidine kinase
VNWESCITPKVNVITPNSGEWELGQQTMNQPPSISEHERQEGALRRLEKLAAVGQEVSTIAHEINSPLESLTNLLYLIRLSDSMEEVQEYATIAQQELARVTEITLQTLRFHRHASKPTEVDLGGLARSVLSLYSGRMLLKNIGMEWRLKDTSRLLCLEGEIRQVLTNLVRNALDAMSPGGNLIIRVSPSCNWRQHVPGVRITVADTGEGIRSEMAGRLFEQFQTTKELTGTGLGLWVSKGIVEKHGGTIRVRSRQATKSRPGGTVFAVWLPYTGKIREA